MNHTCYKKYISEKNIVIVEPVNAKTVIVSLFFRKGSEDFDLNLTEVAQEMKRERVSVYLLRGCIVMQGCFIEPKEFRNNQSSSKGMAKILILSTEPLTQSLKDNPVKVTDKTKIIVQSVRRKCELGNKNNEILAGLDDTVRELQEVLSYPFQYPKCFSHLRLECPKGILLQGAPGVGKTHLVKSVTSQCSAKLITLDGTHVFGPHPGESEENLRKTFEIARNASQRGPCVLFIDELDALCPKRGSSGNEQEDRIVAQLLTLLDGLESRGQLVIIGATNRPNAIDPALRRLGRLDREGSSICGLEKNDKSQQQWEPLQYKCTRNFERQ
ncbi:spermatogenesis-associated protein 5-like protein 1 isoform X1 [Orbicella faveolata]|uniref:spermatogenesis-associated protein 5-like protein 1 isoform X1 n=1 Tax=Orbicella faveolata TaxID=48498 RepID=UPI0009E32015|nr:spermatogenesis-associated protein 5-like protein 1 isoform X1 [Orbicella faveolata]